MGSEQPLKKRRRYEVLMTDGNSAAVETTGGLSPTTPALESDSTQQHLIQHEFRVPGGVQQSSMRELAPDDKLKKKRNLEEIGTLYNAYRRLKFCLARHAENSGDLRQDLEVAYKSVLELSNGCMSVRRLAAELIPRYAVFCPSSLEAASQATFQLCGWSSAMTWQGLDPDGIAVATAEACFSGFVHLSAAAVTYAPEQSAMGVTCTGVCRNVALYLLQQLNGRDLLAPVLKPITESSPGRVDTAGPDKLVRLVSLSLCRVFSVDPEGVLAACFDLLKVAGEQQRQDGLHFISEIMKTVDREISALPSTAEGRVVEAPKTVAKLPDFDEENEGQSGTSILKRNLVAKVVHPKPALERWLVSAVRHFRRTVHQDLVAEVLPLLFSLLKSLHTFFPADLELETEVKEVDKKGIKRSSSAIRSGVKVDDLTDPHREEWVQSGLTEEVSEAGGDSWDEEKENGIGMIKKEIGSTESDDIVVAKLHGGRRGTRGNEIHGSSNIEKQEGETGHRTGREEVSLEGSLTGSRKQVRAGDGRELEKVLPLDWEPQSKSNSSTGGLEKDLTVNASAPVLSPQQPLIQQAQVSSSIQGWLSDGDPAAMDVFAASQHLWVGPLGPIVNESQLRFHFEKLGPLEGVSLYRSRDFALVDFQNVRDAVKAREVMQGATTWGRPVQIKFLDKEIWPWGGRGGGGVGHSCHVWVGGISSQSAKEDLLKGVVGAGLKGPRSVFALVTASAILLEFEAPEEAAAVMRQIRKRRRERDSFFSPQAGTQKSTTAGGSNNSSTEGMTTGNRHLWVGRIDSSIREEELLSSFSKFGDLTGWKFIRTSGCCFIDFRLPECAAVAKAQLNGTRFGIQCIVVEYKNTPQNRIASVPLLTSPPGTSPVSSSGNRFGGYPSLTSALNAIQSKMPCSGTGVLLSRSRGSRGGGREGTERVPTNTLWIGLPDVVTPSFMNEMELKHVFTLAATGVGAVTKVRSARTSRGPCRFVEFNCVEAAAAALQNVSCRFDPSIQIEFSNSAISMQQTENPYLHGPSNLGQSQMPSVDIHQRAWDFQSESGKHLLKSRDGEANDPLSPPADDEQAVCPNLESYPTHPPGWGALSDKEFTEEGYHKDGRSYSCSQLDGSADSRDDFTKSDSGTPRANSFGSFQGGVTDVPGSMHDSPVPSSHPLLGKQSVLDCQNSTPGSIARPTLPPLCGILAPLPVLQHPPWVQPDRIPSTSSWSGVPITLPSSPLGQVSCSPGTKSLLCGPPMAVLTYGGEKLAKTSHNTPPLLQSPVTPGLCSLSLQQPSDQLGNPQAQSMSRPAQPFVDHMVHALGERRHHHPLVHSMSRPLEHMVRSLDPFVSRVDQLIQVDLQSPPPLPPLPPSSPPPPPPSETPPPPLPLSPTLPPPPSSPPPPLPPPPPTDSLPEVINKGRGCPLEQQHWRGPLCKSGMQYCEVLVFHGDSAACRYEHNLEEPIEWPGKLDVTKRADFKSVKNTFSSTPLMQRDVCRLFVSSGAENHDGFEQFISYLKQRERAGVVKIGAGDSMWPRMLYLLPWSIEACALLAISPQPSNCLLGLMLPSLSTFG